MINYLKNKRIPGIANKRIIVKMSKGAFNRKTRFKDRLIRGGVVLTRVINKISRIRTRVFNKINKVF